MNTRNAASERSRERFRARSGGEHPGALDAKRPVGPSREASGAEPTRARENFPGRSHGDSNP